jgi:hypothetical protein
VALARPLEGAGEVVAGEGVAFVAPSVTGTPPDPPPDGCPRSCRLHHASASSSDQLWITRSSIAARSRAVCGRLARLFSRQARIACSSSAEIVRPKRCEGASGIAVRCCWHSSPSVRALNAVCPIIGSVSWARGIHELAKHSVIWVLPCRESFRRQFPRG